MELKMQSSILNATEINALAALLRKNGKSMDHKSFRLLYRASTSNESERKRCVDAVYNKKNVLVIVESVGNDVCGGYTKVGWNKGAGNGTYSSDGEAFIFSIRSSKGYKSYLSNVKSFQ